MYWMIPHLAEKKDCPVTLCVTLILLIFFFVNQFFKRNLLRKRNTTNIGYPCCNNGDKFVGLRDVYQLTNRICVGHLVSCNPASAVSVGVQGKKQVFGSRRAVLNGELPVSLAENEDSYCCTLNELSVRCKLCNLCKGLLVFDDNKDPRLLVSSGRCFGCTLQSLSDKLRRNLLLLKLTDTVT